MIRPIPLLLILPLAAQAPPRPPQEAFFLEPVPDVSLACADHALALGRIKGEYHLLRAQAFAAAQKRAEALAALALAVKLEPKDAEMHVGAARVHLRLGDRSAAKAAMEAAEATAPQSPVPCYLAAQVWREMGDLAEVRAQATKALGRVAKRPGAVGDMAVELMDMGLPQEALALMGAAHGKATSDWELCTNFAAACLRAHRREDAATWFRNGYLARPREEKPRRAMVEAFAEFGTPEDCISAKEALQEAIAAGYPLKNRTPPDLALIGHIHLLLGERDEAEARFREALMHPEAGAEAFRLIGRAWMKSGFEAEALRAYDVVAKGQGVGPQFTFGATLGANPATPNQGMRTGGFFTLDLAPINRKRAIFDAAVDLARLGHKDRAVALAEEAYLLDSGDFDNMATFGKLCMKLGWRKEGAHFLALGGKTGHKDRDFWFAVGQALIETLPPSPVAAGPHP